jgi:hypothetical protein
MKNWEFSVFFAVLWDMQRIGVRFVIVWSKTMGEEGGQRIFEQTREDKVVSLVHGG